MAISKQKKVEVVKEVAKTETDTGSTDVQIALLTERIRALTEHFKVHKKDFHSRTGLTKIVSQRKKLLFYLKRKSLKNYQNIINQLNLRK